MSRDWHIEVDRVWDVLGPFPVHAREQHFLSPAYPLDLSLSVSTTTRYPTSLTQTAYASWSQTIADPHGTIRVSHPSIDWDHIRATEGWAGFQHMNVLRGWLTVVPSSNVAGRDASDPLLRTELLQGAFFAILPPPDSPNRNAHIPEWHSGNIYTLERAPVQLVRLPLSPTRSKEGTRYEVIICAPYEIRLFGDPSAYSSPYPILTLNFSVSLQFQCTSLDASEGQLPIKSVPLQHILAQSIVPNIVDGTLFGDAIGIGVQCLDFGTRAGEDQRFWSVIHGRLVHSSSNLPSSLSVTLLEAPICIAPTQTRIIPLRLHTSSLESIPQDVKQLDIELICVPYSPLCQTLCAPDNTQRMTQNTFVLRTALPLTHVPLWRQEEHVPIQASYFFAKSIPTIFVVKPPKKVFKNGYRDHSKCAGNEPILALHGAGVDILTQSFWADSLLRQEYAWVVIPQGGTAWGLDWHGPSAIDAFATVPALSHILSNSSSGRWSEWAFDPKTRVVLIGHSNGGQGAWYMASRWPDRVCAVVPASGYIKSQAYVSWCMSHFAHFVDPALHAVLDSSLTPDDDDLFLGNLAGKPVLALHGGADDNVPPWHTREQVGILKTWDPNTDVMYHEDPGRPHWYPEILLNDRVQGFLDHVYFSSSRHSREVAPDVHVQAGKKRNTQCFTLTVAVPVESGPLNGWQIHALTVPGLLGRLRVTLAPNGQVSIRTTNVSVFSLESGVCVTSIGDIKRILSIDGDSVPIGDDDTILFVRDASHLVPKRISSWQVLPRSDPHRLCAPRQRLQSILSTRAPLTLLVPSLLPSPELSAALRIAHALHLFHALDAQIICVSDLGKTASMGGSVVHAHHEGNLVVIGCAETPLVRRWLVQTGGLWTYTEGAWQFGTTRFERPSSAILFCHPHPYDDQSVALFLQGTDKSGLERAVRLFPIRTGVVSPDWIVVDGRADTIGTAGVQGAGVYGWTPSNDYTAGTWVWNERMSWLD